MKTKHYQFSTALVAVTMLVLLTSALAHANIVYVAYVADENDHGGIEKFDSSGNGTIFASGLGHPVCLAFDSGSNLYVSSFYDNTIEKFDSSGNGSLFASGLSRPLGLAFDSSGNLYATIWSDGTIKKFDSSGNGTIFASGLVAPTFIVTQVPEPATLLLLGLGAIMLKTSRR